MLVIHLRLKRKLSKELFLTGEDRRRFYSIANFSLPSPPFIPPDIQRSIRFSLLKPYKMRRITRWQLQAEPTLEGSYSIFIFYYPKAKKYDKTKIVPSMVSDGASLDFYTPVVFT